MIKVAVSTREIDGLAVRLARKSSDTEEVMTEIAGIMMDAVEENFEQEGRPEKWTPLADVTIEERRGERRGERRVKGFGPEHPILQRTGTLAASVQAHSSRTEAMVTTNLRYAAIHNFGGEAGRNKKVTIPPRPFMVLTNEEEDKIVGILKKLLDNI